MGGCQEKITLLICRIITMTSGKTILTSCSFLFICLLSVIKFFGACIDHAGVLQLRHGPVRPLYHSQHGCIDHAGVLRHGPGGQVRPLYHRQFLHLAGTLPVTDFLCHLVLFELHSFSNASTLMCTLSSTI